MAVKPPDSTVLGFYSLSASSINAADLTLDLAKKLPRYPHLPVTLLGRLAVDHSSKGQGLGQFLLLDALYRSLKAAAAIVVMAVVVDAKDASAAAFHARYGFMQLSASEGRMFLPMKTVDVTFQHPPSTQSAILPLPFPSQTHMCAATFPPVSTHTVVRACMWVTQRVTQPPISSHATSA